MTVERVSVTTVNYDRVAHGDEVLFSLTGFGFTDKHKVESDFILLLVHGHGRQREHS